MLLALPIALAGCGYRPLYGTVAGGQSVESSLADVRIELPKNRLEQIVRNELLSSMHAPGDAPGASGYLLKLNVSTRTSTVISYPKPAMSRMSAVVTTEYKLFGDDRKKPVASGRVESNSSYDIVRQPFTDQEAADNARQQAALDVAGEIKSRLAIYFSSH